MRREARCPSSTPRRNCAGTTTSAASAPASAAMSPVARDCRIERDAGQVDGVFVLPVDRFRQRRIARPQRTRRAHAAGARSPDLGPERACPSAPAADRQRPRSLRLLPCGRGSWRLSAAGHVIAPSGQRGCTGASSPSVRPRRSRSSPAQAIIAPLSVHSSGGGATKASPAPRRARRGARAAADWRRPRRPRPGSVPGG